MITDNEKNWPASTLTKGPVSPIMDHYPHHRHHHEDFEDIEIQSSTMDSISQDCRAHKAKPISNLQHTYDVVVKFWLWEAAGCMWSMACIISIITVLLYENGKGLDRWEMFLSPNVLVSIIATMGKAPLVLVISQILSQLKWHHFNGPKSILHLRMFDNASRCPLASARLFYASRSVLASAAAALMVSTLLVDPFFQMVFTFPYEPVIDPLQVSSFLQANGYGPGHYSNHSIVRNSHSVPSGQYVVETKLTQELVNSLSDGLTTKDVPLSVTCPSGNCTWSNPVSSLGVCSSCRDMTPFVTRTCLSGYNATQPMQDSNATTVMTCDYQFPGAGPVLSSSVLKFTPEELSTELYSVLWNSTSMHYDVYDPAGNATNMLYIASVFAIQTEAAVANNYEVQPPSAKAWQCNIQWCQKTWHDITVENTVPIVSDPIEQPLVKSGPASDDYFWAVSSDNNTNATTQGDSYLLSHSMLGLDSLGDGLSFAYMEAGSWPQYAGKPSVAGDVGMGDVLASSTDLDATFKNLAAYLTEIVRKSDNSTTVQGDSIVLKAVIRVRWGWLALPLTVVVLTCFLLVAVAIQSHARNIPAWKQDPLALLYHKLEGADTALLDNKIRLDSNELRRISDGVVVELSPNKPFQFTKANT